MSEDFLRENKSPYKYKGDKEHEEVFQIFDYDLDKAKKVDFSFVKRYRDYFQRVYSPEGLEVNEFDDEQQKAPSVMKLYSLSHNINRFRHHQVPIKRSEVEDFVGLLEYLFKIYYKLPRLFFPFPTLDQPDTSKVEEAKQGKTAVKYEVRRLNGGLFKNLLWTLLDATIMCIELVQAEEPLPLEEEVK